jgi:molybdate transport system regulatory protein
VLRKAVQIDQYWNEDLAAAHAEQATNNADEKPCQHECHERQSRPAWASGSTCLAGHVAPDSADEGLGGSRSDFVVGECGADLLHAVEVTHSLTDAARAVGWSYRHAWGYVRRAERRLGVRLAQSTPGKGRERGTVLTPAGEQLLAWVRDLQRRAAEATRDAPRFVTSGATPKANIGLQPAAAGETVSRRG